MVIRTDFTNETDFALAPEGVQRVEVEALYEKESKTNKMMVVFELRAANGGKLYLNCLNEEKQRWMLKKVLHAITGKEQPKGPVNIYEQDYIVKSLLVDIYHDDWNGSVRARIKDVVIPKTSKENVEDQYDDLLNAPVPF